MDYTNLYDFQTSSGIIVPNDASVLLGIQTKFQEIFGTDIDLSAETPVGRLIEAFAVIVKTTLGVNAQTANQFNVNVATGIYLDAIAQIYDLKRIAGTKTRVRIRTYHSGPNTNSIPAGSLIMSPSTRTMFRVDSDIECPSGGWARDDNGNYYGEGYATAVLVGPILAAPGTVTSIQSGILGWIGVTNLDPTYTGTDIETDEAFRQRILNSRPIGIGFKTHLISLLNRLDGVYSNCVLENNTAEEKIIQDVAIPGHSLFVAVNCIQTSDLYKEIANVISQCKPVGTGMVNSELAGGTLVKTSLSYGYDNAYPQDIYFYKAQKALIKANINYRLGGYTGGDIVGDIATGVAEFMDTIPVGGTIYATMLANYLISKLNIGIGALDIMRDDADAIASNVIVLNGYEYPYSTAEAVSLSSIDD